MSDHTTNNKGTNGNKQRDKIPRTTQVKRLWKHAKTGLPMKVWAGGQDGLAKEWLEYKALG